MPSSVAPSIGVEEEEEEPVSVDAAMNFFVDAEEEEEPLRLAATRLLQRNGSELGDGCCIDAAVTAAAVPMLLLLLPMRR